MLPSLIFIHDIELHVHVKIIFVNPQKKYFAASVVLLIC